MEKLKAGGRDLNLGSERTFVTLIKQCNCCLNWENFCYINKAVQLLFKLSIPISCHGTMCSSL